MVLVRALCCENQTVNGKKQSHCLRWHGDQPWSHPNHLPNSRPTLDCKEIDFSSWNQMCANRPLVDWCCPCWPDIRRSNMKSCDLASHLWPCCPSLYTRIQRRFLSKKRWDEKKNNRVWDAIQNPSVATVEWFLLDKDLLVWQGSGRDKKICLIYSSSLLWKRESRMTCKVWNKHTVVAAAWKGELVGEITLQNCQTSPWVGRILAFRNNANQGYFG